MHHNMSQKGRRSNCVSRVWPKLKNEIREIGKVLLLNWGIIKVKKSILQGFKFYFFDEEFT